MSHQRKCVDLVEYAKHGMIEKMIELINDGINVNEFDDNGDCAVIWAAQRNDLEMLRMLIKAGANLRVVNASGVSPLGFAYINQSSDMINYISEHLYD